MIVACVLVLGAGCVTTSGSHSGNERYDALVDEIFEARNAFSPMTATSLGDHRFDSKLEDFTEASIARRIQQLEALQVRLAQVDMTTLPREHAIDADALKSLLAADLFALESPQPMQRLPIMYAGLPGNSIDTLMKRDFAPAVERLKNVIARLEALPHHYEVARTNLQRPPKEFTELSIRIAQGSVGFFRESVPAWAEAPLKADPSLKPRFEAANAKAIEEATAFAKWLESDLLPRSDGVYAIGAKAFLEELKVEEQVELPLPELLARGEQQLASDLAEAEKVAAQIAPGKSVAEVMAMMVSEHPTASTLLQSARDSLEEARAFLVSRKLVTIPSEVRPVVADTPVYARIGNFASMDTPGPLEKSAEAFYYVTPVEPTWDAAHVEEHLRLFNTFGMADINVHEVWPGHYLQFLYVTKFPTYARRCMATNSNAEGWAHYAEKMMIDEGFHASEPRYHLAQLQEALLRDTRYIVGIKLHTEGWSVQQGADFMVKNAFQEPSTAFEEARRGAYNPTYLYYAYGKIEILALRDAYLKKGKTLREFHDEFVAAGPLPLRLMRKVLLEE